MEAFPFDTALTVGIGGLGDETGRGGWAAVGNEAR